MAEVDTDLHNLLVEIEQQISTYREMYDDAKEHHLLTNSDLHKAESVIRRMDSAVKFSRNYNDMDSVSGANAGFWDASTDYLDRLLKPVRNQNRKNISSIHHRLLQELIDLLQDLDLNRYSDGSSKDLALSREIRHKTQIANEHLVNGHTWRAIATALAAYKIYKERKSLKIERPVEKPVGKNMNPRPFDSKWQVESFKRKRPVLKNS